MKTLALSELLQAARAGYWGAKPGECDTDVFVVRNGDIKPSAGVLWDQLPQRSVTKDQAAKSAVQVNDVLITTSGECGVTAFVDQQPERMTCASNFIRVLRVDPALADARYLFHVTQAGAFRDALRPYIRGTTMQNLSTREAFAAVRVPLPSLGEQRRLASILDEVGNLRSRRAASLGILDALPREIFLDCFADTAAPLKSVDEVALPRPGSIRTGPFGSQLLHSEFVESGIAVLGLDNVVSNRFRWERRRYITLEKYEQLKRYTVAPRDVLISIMGTCGRCVVVPEGIPTSINTKHICAITLDTDKVLPEYVRACFLWHPASRRHLTSRTKGSIMDGLNMSIVREMPLPVPPLDVQRAFVDRIGDVEQSYELARRQEEPMAQLHLELQQRHFGVAS